MEERVSLNFLVSAGRGILPQGTMNSAKLGMPKNQKVGQQN